MSCDNEIHFMQANVYFLSLDPYLSMHTEFHTVLRRVFCNITVSKIAQLCEYCSQSLAQRGEHPGNSSKAPVWN